jgi:hypothetical protein
LHKLSLQSKSHDEKKKKKKKRRRRERKKERKKEKEGRIEEKMVVGLEKERSSAM